jgi:rfaE bifunctional protein nucleotidyltransferase chain/domain
MKFVLCHGVFDLLHLGHIRHLEVAKSFGDRLIVSVVPDAFLAKRIPLYNEAERIAILKTLRCVDDAILCAGPGPEFLIRLLRPDIYVRGGDYDGKRMPESDLLEQLGIPVICTESFPHRTSEIIERIKCR